MRGDAVWTLLLVNQQSNAPSISMSPYLKRHELDGAND